MYIFKKSNKYDDGMVITNNDTKTLPYLFKLDEDLIDKPIKKEQKLEIHNTTLNNLMGMNVDLGMSTVSVEYNKEDDTFSIYSPYFRIKNYKI